MPPTDSADPVPPALPDDVWKVIPAETVAKALALAATFRGSRRGAAQTGRELGRLLRDAERGTPGPKRPSTETRQRLTEYGRLIEECEFSRGTAVNLQCLATIPDDKWEALMRQANVPPLTALYALGRPYRDGEGDGKGKGDDSAFTNAVECIPELVDLLARHEHRSTLLYIATHYVGATCDPPLCAPPEPSRVVRMLRRLGPVLGLAGAVETVETQARAAIRANAKAQNGAPS